MKRLQFSTTIAAPPTTVHAVMIDDASYRDWTTAFCEGSYFSGSWRQGERIRFLSPEGGGMVAEIAENRPGEFISIRHLGVIENGNEDTTSEAVRAWTPAYENYSFRAVPGGTELVIEQDITEEYAEMMSKMWPQALARLKILAERAAGNAGA